MSDLSEVKVGSHLLTLLEEQTGKEVWGSPL